MRSACAKGAAPLEAASTGARAGVTLFEVLLAACVLAALMVPLLSLFSSTTEWAGQDQRRVEAMNRAVEIMEQVAHIHKRLGKLIAVPNAGTGAAGDELDLDAFAARFTREQGVPLLLDTSRCAWNTRLFLAPAEPTYRRFLRIQVVEQGPADKNFWPDVLWTVRVRVSFPMAALGPDVRQDLVLTSNFFQKCRPSEKFRGLP
ncbi:MAG: hypothetical protein HY816_09830 [Candidatus Wallbacteria bacterium]|nr:hypothetical protein [Candidatus Wallbacteria bacterium]